MNNEQLKKANEISEKIKEIERFLDVVEVIKGRDRKNGIFFKYKSQLTLFGYRFFGCGSTEYEIKLPYSDYENIKEMYRERKFYLECQLSNMWKDKAIGKDK